MTKNEQNFDAVIQNAATISDLYNRGEFLRANLDLSDLLTVITKMFNILTVDQQYQFRNFVSQIFECQKRKDYLGIADYLRFELPYILTHS